MAKKDLSGYISQFSAFIAGATKLPRPAVAADLQGHVSTLETAINAIVAKSPDASAALLAAENHMAGTGAVLAQGIAASMPAKFAAASEGRHAGQSPAGPVRRLRRTGSAERALLT